MNTAQIAERFLSLPAATQRILIDRVIASEEAMQDALLAGQWGLYSQMLALRSLAGLPAIVATLETVQREVRNA